MSEYIDRDEVLRGIAELRCSPWYTWKENAAWHSGVKEAVEVVEKLCIKKAPAVDAVPVKFGKWIGYAGTIGAECSVCHKWLDVVQGTAEMNYCPNCGARMDEE